MKNTLRSPLFNFCFNFNKKPLVLLVFGALLFSEFAHAQLPVTYDFESGLQGWTSNGSLADRTNDNNWACNGNFTIYSTSNQTNRNIMTSPLLNIASYDEVTISFCHKSFRVDNGEGFVLQYFDGSTWSTVKTFARGTDFFNNGTGAPHNLSETISNTTYTFSTNSRFRLYGNASQTNEYNFFDDIVITGTNLLPCTQPTNQPTNLTFSSISNTSMNISFTPATSSPDSYLILYNTTGTVPSISDTTTYTVGSTFSGHTVISNNSGTSLSVVGLNSETLYYFFVFSTNSDCTGGPDYLNTSPLTNNETTTKYCIPTGTNSSYYIDDFSTTGGVTNITNNNSGYSSNGYGDFTAISVSQYRGSSVDFFGNFEDPTSVDGFGFGLWVDFNEDGDFNDAGESLYNNGYIDPVNDNFTIPLATTPGNYRMRIIADWDDSSPNSCSISTARGEAEDYTLTVLDLPPCNEPTNQPTNFIYNSVTETSMNISFTPATSSPDGYLVVYNTTGTSPNVLDTTTYNIGSTFSGNTVVSNNTDTSFTLTGLTDNTTYYFYIFSFNSACTGGPDYLTTTPLNIDITTNEYCTPTTAPGTSAFGCPYVELGGVGLGNTAPPPVNCSIGEVTLEATYLELGDTSDYTVESIPFSPPYQFGCLTQTVNVTQDDIFSPVINLPFDICFYDNTYSSLVIGANGVVSFDTSLANGPSGYQTSRNIPNSVNANNGGNQYFFGPSIYGVHHDVDPSQGGEIGYQLITLNTGCRAVIASWSDVPMFYDNSILYTGMIVFYEDTNVIEVYVKEKNLDGTGSGQFGSDNWNRGHASIGIQADANTGMAAPGRNTLDSDWIVKEEAWRFVPSGTAITELKWYEGSISPANEIIDPDNDSQITVSPSSTTTYFAEVTYSLCNGTTVIETSSTTATISGNKTWNGSVSTAWENANNWTPVGVPISADCITIPVTANDPIILGSTDGVGYNMEILDGALLTQQSNASLTIEDFIKIEPNGDLEVGDSASIIQIIDVNTNKNNGTARVQRKVDGVNNYDYVYWSTPVDGFNIENVSPGSSTSNIYEWQSTVANGTSGNHGTWVNTTGNMDLGKGYIVRGLSGTSISNTAEFSGLLNNGKINQPISRGSYTGADYAGIGNNSTADDDNWNLLGNPYPSSLSLVDFVTANPSIDGTLYFWRHLNAASNAINDPFYEDYAYNYNENDYLAANSLGSSPSGFNGYIASGQGFFALMLDSAPSSSNVSFNNTMRGVYVNDGFYRNATPNAQEKHRIWIDLVDANNIAYSTLVGFTGDASNDLDRLYDGVSINQSESQFYSILNDKKLTIQGKKFPFENTETFPLGYKTPNSGSFTISLNKLDGVFENANQNIYLEDKKLNVVHNLRTSPYSFITEPGTINDRFVLRFNNTTLSTIDHDIISNVRITSANSTIDARSSLSAIKTFELYDITGRTIHKNIKVDDTNYNYQTNELSRGTYIVQVTLENGSVVSKKVII